MSNSPKTPADDPQDVNQAMERALEKMEQDFGHMTEREKVIARQAFVNGAKFMLSQK